MERTIFRLTFCFCWVFWMLLGTSSATGAGWAELGDAGDLIPTAQDTDGPPGSLDFISGTIFTSLDKDMYKIEITQPALFSATVTLGGSFLDTQLFLFDAGGSGVYANDDPAAVPQLSILPAGHASGPVASGTYYLAISGPDNDPTSLGGEIFDDINPGVQTAVLVGGMDGWTPTFSVFGGTYNIDLTGAEFANATAAVPSLGGPVLAALVTVMSLAGAAILQRRRSQERRAG
jgi:hypothetical protein